MESATTGTSGLTRYLFPEDDSPFRQVVRRHLHMNTITNDGSDAVAPHLAGSVGNDPQIIFEHHPKPSIGQDFVNDSFDGQELFLRQISDSDRRWG